MEKGVHDFGVESLLQNFIQHRMVLIHVGCEHPADRSSALDEILVVDRLFVVAYSERTIIERANLERFGFVAR